MLIGERQIIGTAMLGRCLVVAAVMHSYTRIDFSKKCFGATRLWLRGLWHQVFDWSSVRIVNVCAHYMLVQYGNIVQRLSKYSHDLRGS